MEKTRGLTVVDLGGTRVKFAFSPEGESLSVRNDYRLSQYRNPLELFTTIRDGNPSTAETPWVLGVPSPITDNRIHSTPNLPENWGGPAITNALSELGVSYRLENDANLATLGEFHFGAGKGSSSLVCLTLGTGIGSGIIIDGSLHRGHSGAAGEIGHLTLNRGGRPCGCGKRGCFEQYGSASGLVTTYEQLTGDELSAEDIARRYRSDDSAKKALDATGTHLGRGLALVCNVVNPDCFVLAGGLSNSLESFRGPLEDAFRDNVFSEDARRTDIRAAELEQPALHGGLVLPWQ